MIRDLQRLLSRVGSEGGKKKKTVHDQQSGMLLYKRC